MPAAACATYVPPASDWHLLTAPPHWRAVDFISDVHLHSSEAATANAWRHYLQHTTCDALFILGDLFEVWIGDDMLDNPTDTVPEQRFLQDCCNALRTCAQQRPVYVMCGNRDFLLGSRFFTATHTHKLHDPSVLQLGAQGYLLSHGDAWCWDDHAYLRFRAQVRNPTWQTNFLERSLAERASIAQGLRQHSQARKQASQIGHNGITYADVDNTAAQQWLQRTGARTLIHGHTHRPAQHALDAHRQRWVLSDWDATARPHRLEVLRLQRNQAGIWEPQRQPLC